MAAVGPALYPLWLALTTRRRPDPEPPVPSEWPGLSVVVPAYKEEEIIAAKVADVHRNGYQGSLQVIVVADDPATARAASDTRANLIAPEERLGKAEALNRGFDAATEPIVVFTDANTTLAPASLASLVRWFEEPAVGAVAGEKRVVGERQGAYWRFESWLKRREWRRGSTIGLLGELGAVRRDLFQPLPADLAVDDLWLGLDVIEQGRRIAYEPDAVAFEEPSLSLGAEWERRTRVVCGVLDVAWRRRALLSRSSPIAGELWGHRVVRSCYGPLAHAALLVEAIRSARRSRMALAFVLGHVLAAASLARQERGEQLTAVERVAAQALFLQAVALGGVARYLRGDRPALWKKGERAGLPSARSVQTSARSG